MMKSRDLSRVRRLKLLIPGLCLLMAVAAPVAGRGHLAGGILAGGAIAVANLMVTEQVVRRFLEGTALSRVAAVTVQMTKLGITAAIIALLIMRRTVSPLGLLLGLSTLLAAIVIDIFLFPDKKGSEPEEI